MFAVIGGTGVGGLLATESGFGVQIPTRFGLFRARKLPWCLAVERHGGGHRVPPHMVNYLAIAEGLRRLGAEGCIATAAVGGLGNDLEPGDIGVCTGFVDFTDGPETRFERSVSHTDFGMAFDTGLSQRILTCAKEIGEPIHDGLVYACANGPRYETPDEIKAMRSLGCDVVGMTAAREAIAMREAGVPYACLAIVTNLAAGISDKPLSHEEVVHVMREKSEVVLRILKAACAS